MTEQVNAEFSNLEIAKDDMPKLQELKYTELSEKYAPTHRLVSLATTVIVMLILVFISYQPFVETPEKVINTLQYPIWGIGTLGLIISLYHSLADPKKRYALREQDISYQSGLVFRKTVSQPILRVQHVELKRGPIDRKVGLANLQVFSAGGAMHTFEIPGLDVETAEDIRQFILAHKDINLHG
ncbi:PH domain-containing protein [Thalassotalea psychrophila]|uniref:PH domain-containing protein n=1 Tax=Thalassotalea psychrophila TaxID=3065647 RepID=A0ABY9TU60_9GAMM|nr:PH domain-containing protein [Colwelliaceae bacterium SQ149]